MRKPIAHKHTIWMIYGNVWTEISWGVGILRGPNAQLNGARDDPMPPPSHPSQPPTRCVIQGYGVQILCQFLACQHTGVDSGRLLPGHSCHHLTSPVVQPPSPKWWTIMQEDRWILVVSAAREILSPPWCSHELDTKIGSFIANKTRHSIYDIDMLILIAMF